MNTTSKAYLYLHISVFLWGFTAILGDLISLSAFWLVWWRVGITSFSLLVGGRVARDIKKIPNRQLGRFILVGVLIALHWLTFFGSIKYANASIALVAMSTTALFTSFIEPLFFKVKINKINFVFGVAMIPAMLFIVQGINDHMFIGFLIGLLSAFLAALFAVLNKLYIDHSDPATITFVELGSSWLFLSIVAPATWFIFDDTHFLPFGWDWAYLLVLALMCTTLTFILHLKALKYVSAFVSNLIINLEPVYGITLAALILGDHKELNVQFYIGVVIILLLVVSYPIVLGRTKSKLKPPAVPE